MFRRLPTQLPQDVTVPADLNKLGYFLNDNDQIRKIADPDQPYQSKVNRVDRVNEVYREAMNTCVRRIVDGRLQEIGLERVRLPLGVSEQDQHIPILVSKDIRTKKHIVVLFPDRQNDLGIFSYRVIGLEGINVGSVCNFAKAVLHAPQEHRIPINKDVSQAQLIPSNMLSETGLIIANPSQLIWYRAGSRAVSDREWTSLPRASMVHEAMRIDPVRNRVEGNKTFEEHIVHVFQHVLGNPNIVAPDARLSILGIEYVGSEVMYYLARNWPTWSARICSITFFTPQHSINDIMCAVADRGFDVDKVMDDVKIFISTRTRTYTLSSKSMDQPRAGRERYGNNVYASGESMYDENVIVRAWPAVLDWVELCYENAERQEQEQYFSDTDDEKEKEKNDSAKSRSSTPKKRIKTAEVRDMNISELQSKTHGLQVDKGKDEESSNHDEAS